MLIADTLLHTVIQVLQPPSSQIPLHPPPHCYTVKQRQMSIISVSIPLSLNLPILTFSCLWSIMSALRLPPFLFPSSPSLCITLQCYSAPHIQHAVSWQTEEERENTDSMAEHPVFQLMLHDTHWQQKGVKQTNVGRKWAASFLLTFSSLSVSPPDCSHTVSLALIPPPSFFLLLLWLLLSQTCCCWVSPPSSFPYLCLTQPLL